MQADELQELRRLRGTSPPARPLRNRSNSWPITTLLRDSPIELFFKIDWPRHSRLLVGKKTKSRFCSSTSTCSKTSMTRSGTRPVTACCKTLQNDLRHGGVNRTQ